MIFPMSEITVNLISLSIVSAESFHGVLFAHFVNSDWASIPWNMIHKNV